MVHRTGWSSGCGFTRIPDRTHRCRLLGRLVQRLREVSTSRLRTVVAFGPTLMEASTVRTRPSPTGFHHRAHRSTNVDGHVST
ncbi:MAG: hypothetical protein CMJ41_05845 [Phycisphaerae bacterium]|nr:hypothetical protein [Phycisphaerae bacterium]